MLTWTGPGGSWESPCAAPLAAWQFDGASGGFPAARAAVSNTDIAQWGTDWASRHCSVLLPPFSLTLSRSVLLLLTLSPLLILWSQQRHEHTIYVHIHMSYCGCSHEIKYYTHANTYMHADTLIHRHNSNPHRELGSHSLRLLSTTVMWWALQMLFTELWLTHRGKEEEREGGMEEEAEGGRVRGLAGHSHNEKNLAAAHCVLVMRSMCRRGALLLISGGSQAFHARLVIGPEGAFILGDSKCKRAGKGFGGRGGGQRARAKPSAPLRPVPPSAMIKRYRQGTELQMSVLWQELELDSTTFFALLSPQVATRGTLHPPTPAVQTGSDTSACIFLVNLAIIMCYKISHLQTDVLCVHCPWAFAVWIKSDNAAN